MRMLTGLAAFEQSHCLPEFNGEFVTFSGFVIRWQGTAHTVPFRLAKIQAAFDDLSPMLDSPIHARFHFSF
jgi:hypothetical protein